MESLRSPHNLELSGPTLLQGQVLRESSLPDTSSIYTSPITLRAIGQSLLIPGEQRWHELTLVPNEGGYQLRVGSGQFTVFLLPSDPEVPPLAYSRTVPPGQAVSLDFRVPSTDSLVRLSGKVLRQGSTPVAAELRVQALDDELAGLARANLGNGRMEWEYLLFTAVKK